MKEKHMAFRDFSILPTRPGQKNKLVQEQIFSHLTRASQVNESELIGEFNTRLDGLTSEEVETLREKYGKNHIVTEQHITFFKRLWDNVRNPLVILLVILGLVSYITGDMRATIVIGVMVLLGIVLRFVQESRADKAAEDLQKMVSTTATVVREGTLVEVNLDEIVPGDIVQLSAGDMVPADVRILSAKDLFINQSVLTGESYPVEKQAVSGKPDQSPLEMVNLAFLGTNVESGTGRALVVATGSSTYFGSLANRVATERPQTSFDIGINQFTWLMISLMGVLVPLVFLINGFTKHNWLEALLFALAVAVGLTPEMLPMIVTVNLSKGAIAMAKKKVVVKRLNAIQNFGAMDVLCTDKTGTITQGKIVLEKHMDVSGNENDEILDLAYLNSFHQTGLKNLTDVAILDHATMIGRQDKVAGYSKVDEIPFDFHRKRMSVVVLTPRGEHLLLTKGAVEETLQVCTHVEVKGEVLERVSTYDDKRRQMIDGLNMQGYRVIALAYKVLTEAECKDGYTLEDESNMTLKGFLAFLDPPKDTAAEALAKLSQHKVAVKILTGDNDLVTEAICQQVGCQSSMCCWGRRSTPCQMWN
jgi:Mg2+-importing ATPase